MTPPKTVSITIIIYHYYNMHAFNLDTTNQSATFQHNYIMLLTMRHIDRQLYIQQETGENL